MHPIEIETALVLENVYRSEMATERLERMLAAIKPDQVIELDHDGLGTYLEKTSLGQITHDARTGAFSPSTAQRILVFDTFTWESGARAALLKRHLSLEHLLVPPFTYRSQWNHEWCVCQPAWEMHSLYGCLHACDYCHVNEVMAVMLDLEALLPKIEKKMEEVPSQQLYKYDNHSDQLVLEPEYGASELLVPFFANLGKSPEKYLLLYTKSDNVDHLLGLQHGGRTIINWSLAPRTQATFIEKNTPPVERRLQAMRACERAGYTVRARLSPVIPVDGWQEEYAALIDGLFGSASPDVVTIDVLGFMSPAGMQASLDMALMDAEAADLIKSLLDKGKKWQKHVFPAEYRQGIFQFLYDEIRKHDDTVPVAMCNEEFSSWESCAGSWQPRMEVEDYACCCGPTSVPGNKWLKKRGN